MSDAAAATAYAASVDVGALDQKRDPDVRAVLVEVLAADPGGDDVDGADVAQRPRRLLERLLRRVVGRCLRAADQLDDLHYRHLVLLGKCGLTARGRLVHHMSR